MQSLRKRAAQYHHGDLPRALRAAAKNLLAEGGAEALTLREAARLVGVNHRAVYRHFEDKRALLAALAEEGFERLTARLQAALAKHKPQDSTARLLAIGTEYLAFAQENTALFGLMFGPRLNEDNRFPWLEKAVAQPLVVLVAEMERGVEHGRLRPGDPVDRALSLWTLAHGYSELVLQKRIRVRTAALARRYLRDVLSPLLAGLSR